MNKEETEISPIFDVVEKQKKKIIKKSTTYFDTMQKLTLLKQQIFY